MCKLLYVYGSDEYFILSTRSAPPVQFLWVRRKVLSTEAADMFSPPALSPGWRSQTVPDCPTMPHCCQCSAVFAAALCLNSISTGAADVKNTSSVSDLLFN